MSRIGRLPVAVPNGVTVTIDGNTVHAIGPKGELTQVISPLLETTQSEGVLRVATASTDRRAHALQGLTVRLLGNLVTGVSDGFTVKLEINGVGYKASVAGQTLTLSVGFSHPVTLEAPAGIEVTVAKNVITVSGIDKQAVGQFAAIIRGTKPPEPYKGKGIKYVGEHIRRKAGKAAKAAGATT